MKGRRPEEYEGLVRTVLLMLMLVSAYFIVRGGARFEIGRASCRERVY